MAEIVCSACKHEKAQDVCEGCQYQCGTCGLHLYSKQEVRGHWAIHQEGHSIFTDAKGRTYHQTAEGLHRRERLDRQA